MCQDQHRASIKAPSASEIPALLQQLQHVTGQQPSTDAQEFSKTTAAHAQLLQALQAFLQTSEPLTPVAQGLIDAGVTPLLVSGLQRFDAPILQVSRAPPHALTLPLIIELN